MVISVLLLQQHNRCLGYTVPSFAATQQMLRLHRAFFCSNTTDASVTPCLLLQHVRLHFLSFELDPVCTFDKVVIFDGNDTSARLLNTLCGSTIPGDIVSSGNALFVYFVTNNVDTYAGFSIQYTAIEGTSDRRHSLLIFV